MFPPVYPNIHVPTHLSTSSLPHLPVSSFSHLRLNTPCIHPSLTSLRFYIPVCLSSIHIPLTCYHPLGHTRIIFPHTHPPTHLPFYCPLTHTLISSTHPFTHLLTHPLSHSSKRHTSWVCVVGRSMVYSRHFTSLMPSCLNPCQPGGCAGHLLWFCFLPLVVRDRECLGFLSCEGPSACLLSADCPCCGSLPAAALLSPHFLGLHS